MTSDPTPSEHRFVALVNPIAGNDDAVARWDRIAFDLMGRGIDVETIATENREHAIASAASHAARGRCVIAVGGDGIVRDVAAGVVRSGGVMGLVPCGRGNDLAGKLGLPSDDDKRIVDTLLAGRTRVIDVLDVNGHVVPGNVYVGVDSVAARFINDYRRVPALALYRGAGLAAVARWARTKFTLTITDNGGTYTRVVEAHDIVIANSGRYGNGLNIVPSAELDDGLIDVLVVQHGSPFRIVSMLLAAQRGTHVDRNDVDVCRATAVTIEADRDVPFGADGDEVTELPAQVKVRPKALRIIVDG